MGNVTWKQVAVIAAIFGLVGLLSFGLDLFDSGRSREIDSWYMPKLFGASNVR